MNEERLNYLIAKINNHFREIDPKELNLNIKKAISAYDSFLVHSSSSANQRNVSETGKEAP